MVKSSIYAIVIAAVVVLGIFLTLIFSPKEKICTDEACFFENLKECKKASYQTEEWRYEIKGFSPKAEAEQAEPACRVYVENVMLKDAEADVVERLKGKSMECAIPTTAVYLPHENIDVCHGELKEEILKLMIEKLHLYIIQQLGQFNVSSPG
ncbi:MAG: hypothetical protein QXG39_09700 [Candidatus Aenigmatarchaeota archaeon]